MLVHFYVYTCDHIIAYAYIEVHAYTTVHAYRKALAHIEACFNGIRPYQGAAPKHRFGAYLLGLQSLGM